MKYIFAILGLIFSLVLIKYREKFGDSLGSFEWMKYFGGVYGFVVVIGILIFFWSIATLTGTEDIFLAPIIYLFPGARMNGTEPVSLPDPGYLY